MTIKIALTNLGKYNEGRLVYQWVELPATEEELEAAMDAIGINEEYEEFFISDYETDIDGLEIGEYENLDKLNELAEELEDLEEYELEIVSSIMEYDSGYDLGKALEAFRDGDHSYYPGISDETELGEHVVDEGLFGEVPDNLLNYLDYEAIGRDWRINGGGSFTSKGYIELH